jgi:four helix bundle protein
LAEGCGRESNADLKRFIQIARGSASEVEYHLLLARDLSLLNDNDYQRLNANVNEVKRMLFGFARFLDGEVRDSRSAPK